MGNGRNTYHSSSPAWDGTSEDVDGNLGLASTKQSPIEIKDREFDSGNADGIEVLFYKESMGPNFDRVGWSSTHTFPSL